jgi:hypothetical protein
MNTKLLVCRALLSLSPILVSACSSSENDDSSVSATRNPLVQQRPSIKVGSFAGGVYSPTVADLGRAIRSLGLVMVRQERSPTIEEATSVASQAMLAERVHEAVLMESPRVYLRFDRKFGRLLMSNDSIRTNRSGDDVGENTARESAKDVAMKLHGDGVISVEQYDIDNAKMSVTRQVLGNSDGYRQETIMEYNFYISRLINGIPLRGATIQISVHRSGALSRVKLGGVVASTVQNNGVETPGSLGALHEAAVDTTAFDERFSKQYPNAYVKKAALAYSVLGRAPAQRVEPLYVVEFSDTYTTEGIRMLSRVKAVGYALDFSVAQPVLVEGEPTTPDKGDPK